MQKMAWIREFLLKFTNFKMQIYLISIMYKIFVYGLFVYLVVILDFGYLLVFDFRNCKYAQLHIFISKSACTLHSKVQILLIFVIGFNFIGLFNLSLLDFCTCCFSFTSWLCKLLLLHCLISTYSNYVCLHFVSISIYFLFFILSFMR